MTAPPTQKNLPALQADYAHLLVHSGVNLQTDQSLFISAELAHAPFVRRLVAEAYRAGARYVEVKWEDVPTAKQRLLHAADAHIGYFPEYAITQFQQMVDEGWPRLSLAGSEFPDALDEVDPQRMLAASQPRRKAMRFYMDAITGNQLQWCVAGVPTLAWAQKVYPALAPDAALTQLWMTILRVCRVDQADPVQAWQQHDQALKDVADFLMAREIRSVRYVDSAPGPDGKPSSDLTIGLTEQPFWIGGSSDSKAGITFMANMPTEEIFTTPHRDKANGYVRTAKPAFPFEREVQNAYFRFEKGELVEWKAEKGQDVLDQYFEIEGTRRLGELSLVDVRSPINQLGTVFHDTLFDENAVCHIAFGSAYSEGVAGGDEMSEEELNALGVNQSDAHQDFMIGTATMDVIGRTADGQEIFVMKAGKFVDEALADGR